MDEPIKVYSSFTVDKDGRLCEVVDFGMERITYFITGVTEHPIFGIFFTFGYKSS